MCIQVIGFFNCDTTHRYYGTTDYYDRRKSARKRYWVEEGRREKQKKREREERERGREEREWRVGERGKLAEEVWVLSQVNRWTDAAWSVPNLALTSNFRSGRHRRGEAAVWKLKKIKNKILSPAKMSWPFGGRGNMDQCTLPGHSTGVSTRSICELTHKCRRWKI